ncbi:hypothetical protein LCGC14_3105290, partial [marine sediment metagenome]
EHQEDLADAKRFSKFTRAISKLIRHQKVIENSGLGRAEKRRLQDRIDLRINQIAKRALEQRRR